ncbi:unnamed protein product, partial [Prorocentrum cordatum]
ALLGGGPAAGGGLFAGGAALGSGGAPSGGTEAAGSGGGGAPPAAQEPGSEREAPSERAGARPAPFSKSGGAPPPERAGASEPAPLRLTSGEHQAAKGLLRSWDQRLGAQVKRFQASAEEALQVDRELSEHSAQARRLRDKYETMLARQKAVDHSLDLIWEQQDALRGMIKGLKGFACADAPDGKRKQAEQRTQSVKSQLDEIEKQADLLARQTECFQAADYSAPLRRVGHVLGAHSSELDAIEEWGCRREEAAHGGELAVARSRLGARAPASCRASEQVPRCCCCSSFCSALLVQLLHRSTSLRRQLQLLL